LISLLTGLLLPYSYLSLRSVYSEYWALILVLGTVFSALCIYTCLPKTAKYLPNFSLKSCIVFFCCVIAAIVTAIQLPAYDFTKNVKLIITAGGDKNPAAEASHVWIHEVVADGYRMPVDAFTVGAGDWHKHVGHWGWSRPIWRHLDNMPAELEINGNYFSKLHIEALQSPFSGILTVDFDGIIQNHDLYRSEGQNTYSFEISVMASTSTLIIKFISKICVTVILTLLVFSILSFIYNYRNIFINNSYSKYYAYIYTFIFISILIFITVKQNLVVHSIDPDYHYTIVAFANHFSPDIRGEDRAEIEKYIPLIKDNYALAKNQVGEYYGIHFWFWPLLCTPAFIILNCIRDGLGIAIAHQVTIIFYLALTLFAVCRYYRGDDLRRLLFTVLLSISPILFYISITNGSEAYVFCCLTLSILATQRYNYALATMCLAFGSLQFTSLMPIAGCYALYSMVKERFTASSIGKALLAFAPALLQPIFYLYTFGTWSLIGKIIIKIDYSTINFRLLLTELFDFNQGLILFVPLLLITYLYILLYLMYSILKERSITTLFQQSKNAASLIILLTPIALALCTSIMRGWNCGHIALMRYALHFIPFFIYALLTIRNRIKLIFISAITILIILSFYYNNFNGLYFMSYRNNKNFIQIKHLNSYLHPIYLRMMRYIPSAVPVFTYEMFVYNIEYVAIISSPDFWYPDYKIPYYPYVYYDVEYGIRTMLTTGKALESFLQACAFSDTSAQKYLRDRIKDSDDIYYIDFPWFTKSGKVTLKPHPALDVVARSLKITGLEGAIFKPGTKVTLKAVVKNGTTMPILRVPSSMPEDNAYFLDFSYTVPDGGISGNISTPIERNIYAGDSADIQITFAVPTISADYHGRIAICQKKLEIDSICTDAADAYTFSVREK
jgi:hypothetical protein